MRSNHTTSRRTLRRLGAALAVTVLAATAGCAADGVTVSPEAVAAVSDTFEGPAPISQAAARFPVPPRITLSPAQLTRLSRTSGVSERVLITIAPQLHRQPTWQEIVRRTYAIYRATPDYLREPTVNLGCQLFSGQIRTEEDLVKAVLNEAVALSLSDYQALSLRLGALQLRNELVQAAATNDQRKGSAVLFCYALDQVLQ